jgi:PAS domain-containing protein
LQAEHLTWEVCWAVVSYFGRKILKSVDNITIKAVINSLSDGVYVCDTERRITYWSESAVRITGWRQDDVIGKHCFDNALCHIDKDGHQLRENEFCPTKV